MQYVPNFASKKACAVNGNNSKIQVIRICEETYGCYQPIKQWIEHKIDAKTI